MFPAQSNEVGGSTNMELEGLKRGLQSLAAEGVKVDTLVTDRHVQIQKYLRDEHKEVTHQYDCWHVAKG